MPTYPLPTLAPTITDTGITAPTYSEIYASLQATFQSIYGSDAYIDPDSQDGQLLATFAQAQADSNAVAVAVYNSFSPATAQGRALSNNVKINGIARLVPSKGTVILRVVGVVGSIITDGAASDANGNRWLLPSSVVIPPAGQIDVTATASEDGAIVALSNTITQIVNPQLGWQSVTNPSAASPGAPVETDATLRRRQSYSVALPSQTVLSGIQGAIAAVDGVTQVVVYENDTDSTDANGQPEHSIAAVVLGGSATDIVAAIMLKKTEGCYTHGSIVQQWTDPRSGVVYNVRYSVPTPVPLALAVTIKALAGYTTTIGDEIKAALAAYVNGLGIGKRSDLGRLYLPAQLYGIGSNYSKYEVNAMAQAIKPASPTAADVDIAYNAMATLDVADIALTVT